VLVSSAAATVAVVRVVRVHRVLVALMQASARTYRVVSLIAAARVVETTVVEAPAVVVLRAITALPMECA